MSIVIVLVISNMILGHLRNKNCFNQDKMKDFFEDNFAVSVDDGGGENSTLDNLNGGTDE